MDFVVHPLDQVDGEEMVLAVGGIVPRQLDLVLALEVVDRAATPITWATASMNLGSALIRLGEQEDKRNNWLAAAGAMVPALEVFEAEGATAHADLARRTLKRFHEEWVGLLAPQPTGPVAPPAASHLQQVG